MTNGTISYRNVANANIYNSQVSNILFQGENTFQLNNSTNAMFSGYTFGTNNGQLYQNLTLVNGNTRWQSTNLTMGSGGLLLISNTTATVAGVFTNNGTVRVINSSASFESPVIIGGLGITGVNYSVFLAETGGASTISGPISGNISLTHNGSGTVTLSGSNYYTGVITNTAGSLQVSHASALGSASNIVLTGGTLLFNIGVTNTAVKLSLGGGTLSENNVNTSLGALTLTTNSIINLTVGGGSGSFTFESFTNISATSLLTINNWQGLAMASGTDDRIFFTNDPGTEMLSQIYFTGFGQGAFRLGTGEIVPIPEPTTILGSLIIAGLIVRKRRKSSDVA
jgi:fibronectin-binding autotransporter adhesin